MRNGSPPALRGLGWVTLLAVVLACVVWSPMLASYPRTQIHDAPFFHKMVEVARISVVRFHELPLWNPFECGGVPLWDNPQGIAGAPLVWLTFLLGTTRTLEVWFVVHSVLGVLSMWLFARLDVRLSVPASLVAAVSWSFAGAHNLHFTGGHVVWVAYLYFPLALLLWRRAEHDLRAAVGLGLIVALAMYEGGTYPLPHLAMLLGLETLLRAWPARRLVPIAKAGVVVVAVGLAFGAARFFPVFDQLAHHHRTIPPDTDAMQWQTLREIFLARSHPREAPGQQYVWPEFGDYLGPIVVVLALIGIFTVALEEAWIVVLFAVAFLLMCGRFAAWAPWRFLNDHIYPFKQMRVPSRFIAIVTMFVSVFLGLAVDRLPPLLQRYRPGKGEILRGVVLAAALLGVGDQLSIGESWTGQAFQGMPQDFRFAPHPRMFYGAPGTSPFIEAPELNAPDLICWEEWAFEPNPPMWLGDAPQARSLDAGVRVGLVERTPNTFRVQVDAVTPGRILLNSTYDRGWRTDHGEIAATSHLLSVDVPAGRYDLYVHYWPHGLTLGIFVTVSSFSALIVILVLGRTPRPKAKPWRLEDRNTPSV